MADDSGPDAVRHRLTNTDGSSWGETIVTAKPGDLPDIMPLTAQLGANSDYTVTEQVTNVITIVDANTKQDLTLQANTVIVGQQMNLLCQLNTTNYTATNFQWTVPGIAISNYVVAPDSSSATVLTNYPTTNISTSFYWVDGASNRVVQCSATLGGATITGQAIFNVRKPSVDWIGVVHGFVAADANYIYASPGNFLHFGGEQQVSGPVLGGIVFTATNIKNSCGESTFFFTQTGSMLSSQCQSPTNSINKSASGIDGVFQEAIFYGLTPSSASTYQDSPGSGIWNSDIKIARTDSFNSYLMFQPPAPSVPVPLKKISWGWSGVAIPNASQPGWWTLISSNAVINANNQETSSYPQWTNSMAYLITTTNNICE